MAMVAKAIKAKHAGIIFFIMVVTSAINEPSTYILVTGDIYLLNVNYGLFLPREKWNRFSAFSSVPAPEEHLAS
jgi:hypothetical protein